MKQDLIKFIKKWEGGFSNHPDDRGGATMAGITFATFKAYRRRHGKPAPAVVDLKNISASEWEAIFDEGYWDACNADFIKNKRNACIIVSWAWGSGTATAVKLFQKNFPPLKVDGIVGKQTIAALENADFMKLCDIREQFYRNIVKKNPSQKVFLKGWLNRLNDFRKTFNN